MDQQPDSYRIRLARPDEIPRLREIEDEAGTIFSGLGLIDEALDVVFPVDDLVRLVGMGQVWVGCPENDLPVGMVIASVREEAAYVEEMDVLPSHGRRGLGARLLACVCAWARAEGHAAVTLSTFRDVPWNGPFYRKHGFRDLQPAEWTPGMRAIRAKEARHGLRVEARVFMRRELGGVENHIMTKSTPSSEELQFLEDRLYEFNRAQTGQDDGQLFAFFVRNDQQEIVAGLSGWTWAKACEIRMLWVHPAWRGQGYGRSLLESAEQEARGRGCKVILISSYSFQAPAFYQKGGYELAWQLNDFPPGQQNCYLVKRFTETE